MPIGQAATHWLQSMQLPRPSQVSPFLCGAARLAAVAAIGDGQRLVVDHRRLDARPGAHIGADLLAHQPAQRIGGEGEAGDGGIDCRCWPCR